MKVIIAGSRSITDAKLLHRAICDALGLLGIEITELVCGMCPKGVDMLGYNYAKKNHIPIKPFPAKWRVNGYLDKQAGNKRNFEMGKYADAAIILWDGVSSGSKNMYEIMVRLKKPVHLVKVA